jgi:hypothetical protein
MGPKNSFYIISKTNKHLLLYFVKWFLRSCRFIALMGQLTSFRILKTQINDYSVRYAKIFPQFLLVSKVITNRPTNGKVQRILNSNQYNNQRFYL